MAVEIGDIWPFSSGTSSLGAEQLNGPADGFTNEIRPFNHIHFNSGVIHDPILGSSGVIRFNAINNGSASEIVGNINSPSFEFSTDGGKTYLCRLSVDQVSISDAPTVLLQSLDASNLQLYASGSLNAFSEQAMGLLTIDGDILIRAQTPGGGANGNIGLTANKAIAISNVDGAINILASRNILIRDGSNINAFDLGVRIHSNADDVLIEAATSTGDNVGIGGQIQLKPFDSSGVLEFRFGPHQAWYEKLTHASTGGPFNDGYWPMPHSGQILEMIDINASLQTAYEGGEVISTSVAQGGPVRIIGTDTYGLHLLQNEAGHPHILFSGVKKPVSFGNNEGSFYLSKHSLGRSEDLARLNIPTLDNDADIKARSVGHNTFFINTGSGIANVSVASGIASFVNLTNSSAIDETGLNINFIGLSQLIPDNYMTAVSNSGIIIYVPGFYRLQYSVFADKTLGNLAQTIRTSARVNDKFGRTFEIFGGESYAYLRNNNQHNKNTATAVSLVDFNAGDTVNLHVRTTEAPPADNSVRIPTRGSSVVIEYIGPQRGLTTKQVI